jgi:glyoxylase-like metal-dependent hydrolase (beta-lactamase superfamily II)
MSTADTTTEAFADTRPSDAADLPDCAPIPKSALGPALNEQGYHVGRVERNLYAVTDGAYQSAFLTTSDGVVLLDAPPTIGHNIRRAVDETASANGVSNKVTHLIYSHHHADHAGAASLFDDKGMSASATRRRAASSCATTTRRGPRQRRRSRTSAASRSAVSASTWRGSAPTTRPTTSTSTCRITTRWCSWTS